ncbi:BPTI/Kunitz domain-containing protein-like [Scyliorhinus torazame]|uniref:BPTI/Kunitz domain-containing protein-like n=1 Tax=Scyliorhinus torazame TaxID=75743 RepID=UPI003B596E5E
MKFQLLTVICSILLLALQFDIVQTDNPACSLPRQVGRCRGSMIRFYYNQDTQACQQFTYGGCGGNANNFETMSACQTNCPPADVTCIFLDNQICSPPRDAGRCRASIIRFYYNQTTQTCQQFTYGGCGGNANNFESMSECQRNCPPACNQVCSLPPEVGQCRASLKRFYYNNVTKVCEEFTYGGCRGNENNFITMSACQRNCPYVEHENVIVDALSRM